MKKTLILPDPHQLMTIAHDWIMVHVLAWANAQQLLGIILALFLARLAAPRLQAVHISFLQRRGRSPVPGTFSYVFNRLILPLLWLLLLWLGYYITTQTHLPHALLRVAVSLLFAWVVIRFTATLIRNPALAKLIAFTAWTVAALNILNLFGPTMKFLDGIAFNIGDVHISILTMLKAIVYLGVALWLANLISELIEGRLSRSRSLTPSVGVLISKFVRFGLITAAFLMAVSTVGIDLTVFAVFGGALGVGLGFGLQKVVSNFISGIILLLDKSIKPGDVISIGDTYGWVNSLNARYVSLDTVDGKEHLIPNEELIIQRVENWSYSNKKLRLRVPVGVHYKSDVRAAMQLCVDAANEVERVLDSPAPTCALRGFGDSSVDLEVAFWIRDPENGIINVTSDVLLGIWDKFHEHGVEIPYPQRDVYLKTPIDVRHSPDSKKE
jgi:small-conductance mechanosensitive channel